MDALYCFSRRGRGSSHLDEAGGSKENEDLIVSLPNPESQGAADFAAAPPLTTFSRLFTPYLTHLYNSWSMPWRETGFYSIICAIGLLSVLGT
jgi:hypothetical protein